MAGGGIGLGGLGGLNSHGGLGYGRIGAGFVGGARGGDNEPPLPSPLVPEPSEEEQLLKGHLAGVPAPPPAPLPAPAAPLAPVAPDAVSAPAPVNPMALAGPPITDPVGKDQKRVSTTVTSGQLAPEQKAALGDIDKAGEALVEAERKAAGIRKDVANIQEMEASERSALAAAREQRISQVQQQGNARIEAARARAAEVEAKFQKAEIKDYWADKSTGSRVLAAIAVGLGAIGSALAKGPNHALQIVQHTIDSDLARQRANIDKMKDNVLFARTGIRDAEEAKEQLLADASVRSAAQLEASASKWSEMKARLGAPMEEVMADKNIATLRAAAAERRAQALEPLTKRVSTTTERVIATMDRGAVPGAGVIFGAGAQPIAQVADPKKADGINKAIANFREIDSLMGDLDKSYAKGVSVPLVGDESARRSGLLSRLTTLMKEQQNLGALAGPDAELLAKQVGGKFEQVAGGAQGRTKLETARTLMNRGMSNFLDQNGVPGQRLLPVIQRGDAPTGAPAGVPAPAAAKPDVAGALKWLASPAAAASPEKAKAVREKLRAMGAL